MKWNRTKNQKGLALVEFVFTMPFLFTLFTVAFVLGKMMHDQSVLTASVINGGRFLSIASGGGYINDVIKTATKNMIIYGNPSGNIDNANPLLDGLADAEIYIQCEFPDPIVTEFITLCTPDANGENPSTYTGLRISVKYNYTFVVGNALVSLFGNEVTLSASTTVPATGD